MTGPLTSSIDRFKCWLIRRIANTMERDVYTVDRLLDVGVVVTNAKSGDWISENAFTTKETSE